MTAFQPNTFEPQAFDAELLAVVADGGTYAVVGANTTLGLNGLLFGDTGAHTVAGSDVAFTIQSAGSVVANGGTYTVAEADAALRHANVIVGAGASYEIVGHPAALRKTSNVDGFQSDGFQYLSYQMPFASVSMMATGGSHAVSGADAILRPSAQRIYTDGGTYLTSGTDAALDTRWYALAESGGYSVTGSLASLRNPLRTGYVYVWMGTEWVEKPVRVWDGTDWRACPLKYYDDLWRLA